MKFLELPHKVTINFPNSRDGQDHVILDAPKFNSQNLQDAVAACGVDGFLLFKLQSESPPLEQQILVLKKDQDKVGYIIPGTALCSTSDDLPTDGMFGAYALLAIHKLAEKAEWSRAEPPSDLKNVIDENYFYCIVEKKRSNADSIEEFLDKYFLRLITRGFYDGSISNRTVSFPYCGAVPQIRNIELIESAHATTFLRKLFFSMIPHAEDPFFAFFYAWQIVEHLMHREFSERFANFVSQNQQESSIVRFRQALDKLNELSKEKSRIKAVFQKNDETLLRAVKTIYDLMPVEAQSESQEDSEPAEKKTCAQMLYYTRNMMFHSFQHVETHKAEMRNLIGSLCAYLADKCQASTVK